jgi:hypothetical protein
MIFEFLFPIVGWLIFFGALFFIYNAFFYQKPVGEQIELPGQATFTLISSFFWVVVYMCLSSIWSILYTLIDIKYPDIINAPSNYGSAGLSLSGAIYDAMAFPLATLVVSAVSAVALAWWIMSKQKQNPVLRPDKLYKFIKFVTLIGGGILAFSGFVYVVYAWLYGSLPVAVFLKGLVAFVIVGSVALYFYLVAGETRNPRESLIGKIFSAYLLIAMVVTLFVSFNVVGTPKEARLYRLDSLKIQDLQQIKNTIDNQDSYSDKKVSKLSDIKDEYTRPAVARNEDVTYTSDGKNYTMCANFVSQMPQTVNNNYYVDDTWNYKKGQSCFTFEHKPNYQTQKSMEFNAVTGQIDSPVAPISY